MQLKHCSPATLTSSFLTGSGARDAASWCGVLWPALKARAVNGPLPWCRSGSSRPMWRSRMDVMKLLGWQVVGPVRCGLRWCWRAVRMVGELRRSETCYLPRPRRLSKWCGPRPARMPAASKSACPTLSHALLCGIPCMLALRRGSANKTGTASSQPSPSPQGPDIGVSHQRHPGFANRCSLFLWAKKKPSFLRLMDAKSV